MQKIAVFASGSGTNAENLAHYFSQHDQIRVTHIFSNKEDAFVHERAARLNIPSETFSRSQFKSAEFPAYLAEFGISCIVLAGFLWLIPPLLIERFPNSILNIHPSLLPAFGGKGMYGEHVHRAVIAQGVAESGITIHLVNDKYDEGKVLFQAKTDVQVGDDHASLARRIHQLEYEHFPSVVENFLLGNQQPLSL